VVEVTLADGRQVDGQAFVGGVGIRPLQINGHLGDTSTTRVFPSHAEQD